MIKSNTIINYDLLREMRWRKEKMASISNTEKVLSAIRTANGLLLVAERMIIATHNQLVRCQAWSSEGLLIDLLNRTKAVEEEVVSLRTSLSKIKE